MKNYLKIYLLLISSIFIFTSCDEDIDLVSEQNSSQRDIELITNGNSNKSSGANTMLHFSTMEIFEETIKKLEIQYEENDDAFLAQWGHLGGDDLDLKEDELNYTPQQPFIDFEKQFKGFKSLREDIETKEKKWLNNEVLDEANDPYDHFVFDEEIRTVLNTNGQVKIGKELYQMTMFGYIKVTDGDFKTLDLVLNNDIRDLDLPNVIIIGSYDGTVDNSNTTSTTTTDGTSGSTTTTGTPTHDTSCRTWINATQYYYPAYKRKIKGYQKLLGYSVTGWFNTANQIRAKTRHFKKKRRGWRCRRGPIGVKILGDATFSSSNLPNPCYEENYISKSKYRNRKRKVKVKETVSQYANIYFGTYQHKLYTEHKRSGSAYDKYFWN